jgi:DNA-binding response OmpR family regulator
MEVLARIKTHLSIKEQHSQLLASNYALKTEKLNNELIKEDKLLVEKDRFKLSFNNISIELTSLEFNLFLSTLSKA